MILKWGSHHLPFDSSTTSRSVDPSSFGRRLCSISLINTCSCPGTASFCLPTSPSQRLSSHLSITTFVFPPLHHNVCLPTSPSQRLSSHISIIPSPTLHDLTGISGRLFCFLYTDTPLSRISLSSFHSPCIIMPTRKLTKHMQVHYVLVDVMIQGGGPLGPLLHCVRKQLSTIKQHVFSKTRFI